LSRSPRPWPGSRPRSPAGGIRQPTGSPGWTGTGGSASYRIGAAALDQAIAQLAPAEACAAYDHPNLAAWRRLRAGMHDRDEVLAVFAADLDEPSDDPWVGGLRAEVLAEWNAQLASPIEVVHRFEPQALSRPPHRMSRPS
jgi:hypothetical protein